MLLGALPIWQLIARYSNDLVFDGIIFDIIIVVVYVITVSILTQGYLNWTLKQILGLILIFVGIVLYKI